MSTVKRAIFIAAGEGKRLRPVTSECPKPLVSVNGTRIIDSSIAALRKNGIEDIYIVTGYKKEAFYDAYRNDSHIHIIENKHYLEGNNITSLYEVRQFIPESFILEADILVQNDSIFTPEITHSGYFASWMEPAPEWILTLTDGRITDCEIEGSRNAYRLWGISMWNKEDGERLSEEIRHYYEDEHKWDIYWDLIALQISKDNYSLGIRDIPADALKEIDTVAELAELDGSYRKYL